MIYFIQTGDNRYIKIGYTAATDVKKRIASIQTSIPFEVKVLATMPGTQEIERQLHKRFGGLQERGEWFRTQRDLVTFAVTAESALHAVGDSNPLISYAVLEPRILTLLIEAAAIVDDGSASYFCANEIFFGDDELYRINFKERVIALAGWEAENRALRTTRAYDVVYDAVYAALPDCRGDCSCM